MRSRQSLIQRALLGSLCLAAWFTAQGDPAPGRASTVTVSEGTNLAATISPDRKTLILDLQTSLWRLPAGGGTAKRLTDGVLEASHPDWSPKGDLVAFQSFRGGTFHIWLMKPDGTGQRQLTEGHGDDRDPRFSPDGKRVAFSSDRALHGNYDIWVVELGSGKMTQWTSDNADEYEPAWSPDGAEIAFVSGMGSVGTAIRAAHEGASPRTVVEAPEGARVNAPSWSPDAKQVAYVQTAGNKVRLMVSGKAVGIADDVFPFPPTWLSAEQVLYTANGKIWKTRIATGATDNIPFQATFQLTRSEYKRRVPDFDSTADRAVKGILAPAISPDGKRVAFEALNQLWLLEIGGAATALTKTNSTNRPLCGRRASDSGIRRDSASRSVACFPKNAREGQYLVTVPQAMRSPALPEGSLIRSSALA